MKPHHWMALPYILVFFPSWAGSILALVFPSVVPPYAITLSTLLTVAMGYWALRKDDFLAFMLTSFLLSHIAYSILATAW